VGKTEIARRLARLAGAPFLKIEATKFTEVGYVGRDVESIIRDLMDVAVKQTREQELAKVRHRAEDAAEERVLDLLLPGSGSDDLGSSTDSSADTRQKLRKRLREGQLDDKQVEIEVTLPQVGVEIMAPPGMEELTQQLQGMFQNMGGQRTRRRQVRVAEALRLLTDEEAAKFVNEDDIKRAAVANAEQNGIVFIDEIDKITQRGGDRGGSGGEVSREGVQRDLLPLIEGSTVTTKHGQVRTDHILFIASGAFHLSKPSDLIPELQGRLPIRVELDSLRVEDFERILTDTDAALTEQASALLATEGVTLQFVPDGVRRLAQIAHEVNERTENIGARRLHTVMERLLEDLSFAAADRSGSTVTVDAAYVDERLKDLAGDQDLSRYIL
uniref:ATP-dependent protease ATPase subunit HslU n=1 Tax=Immundisolibacter sp. TaxID=1934948 RepID=UPI0035673796